MSDAEKAEQDKLDPNSEGFQSPEGERPYPGDFAGEGEQATHQVGVGGQPQQAAHPVGADGQAQQAAYPMVPGSMYQAPPPLDGISLASFITSMVGLNIVGIVLGAIGLSRTQNGARQGRGFAIAGLVIGIVSLVFTIVVLVLFLTGAVFYGSWT